MSQVEAAVYSLSPWIADYSVNGAHRDPPGQQLGPVLPARGVPCKGDDRWVAIACSDDEDWSRAGRRARDRRARVASRLGSLDSREARTRRDRRDDHGMDLEPDVDRSRRDAPGRRGSRRFRSPISVTRSRDPQLDRTAATSSRSSTRSWASATTSETASGCLTPRPVTTGRARLLGEHNEIVLGEILGMSYERDRPARRGGRPRLKPCGADDDYGETSTGAIPPMFRSRSFRWVQDATPKEHLGYRPRQVAEQLARRARRPRRRRPGTR